MHSHIAYCWRNCHIVYHLTDEVANPYILTPKGSLMMKYHLQNQPWNSEFSLKLEGLRPEEKNLQTAVNKQIDLLDR